MISPLCVPLLAPQKVRHRRLCGPQSKNGCFTCKARRIKCDETKPTCQRCRLSRRLCQGYPERRSSKSGVPLSNSGSAWNGNSKKTFMLRTPPKTLRDHLPQTQVQDQLAKSAIFYIAADAFDSFGSSGLILERLLPQLNHYVPSVNAAATALGAALLIRSRISFDSAREERLYTWHSVNAIKNLRLELATRPFGVIPLLMSCLLLSITENLVGKEQTMLMHCRAAYQLLGEHRMGRLLTHSQRYMAEDDLELLFRSLDLQFASLANNFNADIPDSDMKILPLAMQSLDEARLTYVRMITPMFHWLTIALQFRYQPEAMNASFEIEQGRYISQLSQWLGMFEQSLLSRTDPKSHRQTHAFATSLRMQCVAMLIAVSTVLCAEETSYDAHAFRFQQIIKDAEIVISYRRTRSLPAIYSSVRDSFHFSTGPGILPPLYLTAERYRQPQWRRKAIQLIWQAGQEGPWNGVRQAVTVTRILQYEESWPNQPPSQSLAADGKSAKLLPVDVTDLNQEQAVSIPEEARLQRTRMETAGYEPRTNKFNVTYHRCVDVKATLNCPQRNYFHGIPLEQVMTDIGPNQSFKTEYEVVECPLGHFESWEEELIY